MQRTILWFRGHDLRLTDNPALNYAAAQGEVIPLYIHIEDGAPWGIGSASCSWLHHSLEALDHQLRQLGSQLIIRRGHAASELLRLIHELTADEVVWLRSYTPVERHRDKEIRQILPVSCRRFSANLLFQRGDIFNKQGQPYRVFTPYWRACLQHGLERPLTAMPKQLNPVTNTLTSLTLQQLELLPTPQWDRHFYHNNTPGEEGAIKKLHAFVERTLIDYAEKRDQMASQITSGLSPHLRFGEISPQRIVDIIQQTITHEQHPGIIQSAEKFLAELGWREFAHMILYHYPESCEQPLNEKYQNFPWQYSPKQLQAWQRGETGIPLVDAGMRELWQSGTMHNRVRMIVASFLTKNCGIHWLEGARWFWDTLLDADLAANTLNWQWVAGSGADAAPYYRIFNPVGQGEKFDGNGSYVRRWIPELSPLPTRHLHQPWNMEHTALASYGVHLGENYPHPIVDLKQSREKALVRYQQFSQL